MNLQINNLESFHPVYKLIESIRIMGSMRSISGFSRYLLANKIYTVGDDSEKAIAYIEMLTSIIPLLNKKFGQNWDFHLQPRFIDTDGDDIDAWSSSNDITPSYTFTGFDVQIVILYPVVELTNSKEHTRTLTDLFVTIPIKCNGSNEEFESPIHFGDSIFGARGSSRLDESYVGFKHSHLTTGYTMDNYSSVALRLDEFCLGDNEIANLLSTFSGEGYSVNMFELFLHTLDTFVGWESIEGGPYYYMDKVTLGKSNPIRIRVNEMQNEYSTLKRYIRRLNPTDYNLDFVIHRNRFKIKLNSKFEEFIINTMESNYVASSYLCVQRDGNYYEKVIEALEAETKSKNYWEDKEVYTMIQGRKIQYHIKEIPGERPEIKKLGLHPEYIKYVSEQLEQEIYRKTIRKSAIIKFQNDNATAVSR